MNHSNLEPKAVSDPLAFASGWSLGEEAYQRIREELGRHRATTIVEFGSGTSTLRLSRDLPNATILSIESDPHFFRETGARIEELGGKAAVDLALRPIVWQRHALGLFRSYRQGPFPSGVDAILIDGPPIETRRGREACLYQVFPFARLGARIYLDDYCRAAEQQIVRNWLRAYPGALAAHPTFLVDAHVAVLEKVGNPRVPKPHLINASDSLLQNGRHLLGGLRARWSRFEHSDRQLESL